MAVWPGGTAAVQPKVQPEVQACRCPITLILEKGAPDFNIGRLGDYGAPVGGAAGQQDACMTLPNTPKQATRGHRSALPRRSCQARTRRARAPLLLR